MPCRRTGKGRDQFTNTHKVREPTTVSSLTIPSLAIRRHLQELDKTEEEELDALDVDETGADEESGELERQIHRFRVVHHLLRRRGERNSRQ